jgi:mannitol-1-phosphate 5-dehydrogenase
MRAVVVGAGRIGCGFAGDLLDRSGYDLTFVTRSPAGADHLNRVGRYVVRLVGRRSIEERTVTLARAVHCSDAEAVAREIAGADVVATAVGPGRLAEVAPLIAAGLARRRTPVNVLAFENDTDPGARLRAVVAGTPGGDAVADRHGFSGALVPRVVSQMIGDRAGDDPLVFVGDPPNSFVVDVRRLVPPVPGIAGMVMTDDWAGWLYRKLYLFGAGHAMTAYLGHLKGYHYVHSAIRDPEIRATVRAAMAEGQRGVAARYGQAVAGGEADLDAILRRFENAALNDTIGRVGRDPRRKLAADDRLVGAARLAAAAGGSPEKLLFAVAAALCFADPVDVLAAELRREIARRGLDVILATVCGLEPSQGLGRVVLDWWRRLSQGSREGNLLLHLEAPMWA